MRNIFPPWFGLVLLADPYHQKFHPANWYGSGSTDPKPCGKRPLQIESIKGGECLPNASEQTSTLIVPFLSLDKTFFLFILISLDSSPQLYPRLERTRANLNVEIWILIKKELHFKIIWSIFQNTLRLRQGRTSMFACIKKTRNRSSSHTQSHNTLGNPF